MFYLFDLSTICCGGLPKYLFTKSKNHVYSLFHIGWFFTKYPRHRKLISINKRNTGRTNKEFNLRHDWNSLLSSDPDLLMTKYTKEFFPTADIMVDYLKDFAKKQKLNVQYETEIERISRSGDCDERSLRLRDFAGHSYRCRYLIVSTGLGVENIPEELSGVEHTIGYPDMLLNKVEKVITNIIKPKKKLIMYPVLPVLFQVE